MAQFSTRKVQCLYPVYKIDISKLFKTLDMNPKCPLTVSKWTYQWLILMIFYPKLQKKFHVADSMTEIFLSAKNVFIGMWNNRFWRNFGCTFFLQLIWLQRAVDTYVFIVNFIDCEESIIWLDKTLDNYDNFNLKY